MISLTRETIDNIFEPRLKVNLGVRPARYRLLVDAEGRFQHIGEDGLILIPSRKQPEREHWYAGGYNSKPAGWKKGTYPAWMETTDYPQEPLWEILPQPVHQMQIMEAFYKIAFPQWDAIVKIDGWPRVSKATWSYIWEKFAAFDRRMHPDVLPGGAWGLGSGFSGAERKDDIPDWKIDLSPATVAYKWTPFRCSITRTDNEYEGHQWSRWANYIEWDVWLARGDGEKWRMSEHIDPSAEQRPDSLESAMDQCAARVGCLLKFSEVPPHNEHINAEWQSEWMQTQKEVDRAA